MIGMISKKNTQGLKKLTTEIIFLKTNQTL